MSDILFIDAEFRQRSYDGRWELVAMYLDLDQSYAYINESGVKVVDIPKKWITVRVYDWIGEIVD